MDILAQERQSHSDRPRAATNKPRQLAVSIIQRVISINALEYLFGTRFCSINVQLLDRRRCPFGNCLLSHNYGETPWASSNNESLFVRSWRDATSFPTLISLFLTFRCRTTYIRSCNRCRRISSSVVWAGVEISSAYTSQLGDVRSTSFESEMDIQK